VYLLKRISVLNFILRFLSYTAYRDTDLFILLYWPTWEGAEYKGERAHNHQAKEEKRHNLNQNAIIKTKNAIF
jgi:hypothetical protein